MNAHQFFGTPPEEYEAAEMEEDRRRDSQVKCAHCPHPESDHYPSDCYAPGTTSTLCQCPGFEAISGR